MRLSGYAFAGATFGMLLVPCAVAQPQVHIFPNLPHAASNTIPFGDSSVPGITTHQVFASTLFSAVTSGQPAEITRIAFAPTGTGTLTCNLAVRLGYTNAVPGVLPPTGLDIPNIEGGGAPNASGPMHVFSSAPVNFTVVGPNSENFQFVLDGTPFTYDPALGNLLLETVVSEQVSGISISRSAGSAEASRSYRRINGTTSLTTSQAHRTQFTFTTGPAPCYANCDESTQPPVLNVADFGCFLTRYAAGEAYANCDDSTQPPVLNVADFGCFLTKYAAGCP